MAKSVRQIPCVVHVIYSAVIVAFYLGIYRVQGNDVAAIRVQDLQTCSI